MTRALAAIILALAALAARAQIETPDEPTVFLDFGFAGEISAGAWSPVTAVVQSVDEPLSGYVELTYIAGGETIAHVAPFAVAAQDNAAIPMTVRFPWWTDTATITAYDERRGRVASLDYKSRPGPTDARLPATRSVEGIVLSATPRLPAAQALELAEVPDVKPPDLLPLTITPDRLVPSRLAYDNARLVILDPASLRGADPRAIQAIIRWTAAGGHLLLIADRPGAEWQRFLAATPATSDVTLGPAVADEAAVFRTVSLGPTAVAAGWTTLDAGARTRVAAEGPFALGWLSVLTIDPLAPDAAELAARILAPPASDLLDDLAAPLLDERQSWYSPYDARGTDWLLYQHIDAVATSTPPGTGGFVLIAAVPIALALLLGPLDFLLLGALRRRHLAWLSALVWISILGSIAAIVPTLFQTGKADIGTVAATDLVAPNLALPSAQAVNRPAELDPALAGWTAETTLLFHASRTPFSLAGDRPLAWRPLDAGGEDIVALTGTTYRQSPAGPGAAAAAAVTPLSIPARIWSLVTLHAEGPAAQPFGVALARDNDSASTELTLDLPGLPETAAVRAGRVVYGGRAFTVANPSRTPLRFTTESQGGRYGFQSNYDARQQAALAVLAGEPQRRNRAVNTLSRAGWARIDLLIENPPTTPGFETTDDATRTGLAHYRIITPMPAAPTEQSP